MQENIAINENARLECRCECGSVSYMVAEQPLFRMYCHCTICQKFNDADYGDIFIYRAADVQQPDKSLIEFNTYRPPPNVQRGRCASCSKPAIEVLQAPLIPKLIMVPGNMHADNPSKPISVGHVFYETRVADVADDLPKHSGYLRSQLVFGKHFLKAVF